MSESTKPNYRKRRLFPRQISDCIEPVAKKSFAKHGFSNARLIRDWADITSPAFAAKTQPLKLIFPKGKSSGGTLTILIEGGGAALELQHYEPILLEKLAVYFGYRAVDRIRLHQGLLPRSEETLQTANVAASSPQYSADMMISTQGVQDEGLRDALKKLSLAISGKQD